MKKFQPF